MRSLKMIVSAAAGLAALAVPALAAAQPGCVPQAAGGTAATSIPCSGYYDADGVWRQGGGHYDADGNWHSDSGHFDNDGAWVATTATTPTPDQGPQTAGQYGVDTAYVGPTLDIPGRENWLEGRIRMGQSAGMIKPVDASADLGRLAGIRDVEARLSLRHGGLTDQDRADLGVRLQDLAATVSAQWRKPY